ncbi:MAG TPA: contractile injection system protein, VgrG/Pvc8 family [Candidatus Binataceae bacterium]|nr:contractile injection system protein, VgrG/Pvc8 family [Candidatus Binataceae bacterium]
MAAEITLPVRVPNWVITYQGVNITADISQMIRRITHTDRLGGVACRLEVGLEDRGQLWQGPWYPSLGDQLNLMIGYEGGELLPCGDFQVDDLVLEGTPDLFHLRCISAFVTPAMRTANSIGYENQTLTQIAAAIAAKYGLTVVGAPDQINVVFERVTQKRETDLSFLRRLANEHGYDFTIRGTQLVFYSRAALEASAPVWTIVRSSELEFRFRNRTRLIYKAAQVAYQSAPAKQLIVQMAAAATPAPTGDTLKLVRRCENGQQAALKAQAALELYNRSFVEAEFVMPGTTLLVAGNAVSVAGWGAFDGTYLIERAIHRLERSGTRTATLGRPSAHPAEALHIPGYTTEITARRVGS